MLSSFYGRTSLLANNQLAAYQNPAFSIPVFSEPEGKSLGLITFGKKSRKSSRFDEFKISFFNQDRSEEDVLFINLISNDLGLLFKEEQNDYIKIVGYSGEIWIRTDDLDNLNIKYTSLDDFLDNDLIKGSILYPGEESLLLRSGSGDGFRKIIDLYGNDYKMEYARKMLDDRSHKVNEVSEEVGYSNPSHFIAAFKRKYGITPKKYVQALG